MIGPSSPPTRAFPSAGEDAPNGWVDEGAVEGERRRLVRPPSLGSICIPGEAPQEHFSLASGPPLDVCSTPSRQPTAGNYLANSGHALE